MPDRRTVAVSCAAALCVLLGWEAGHAGAASDTFHWAGWKIPATKIVKKGSLSIEADAEAQSQREVTGEDGKKTKEKVALAQRVSRRRLARDKLAVARTPGVRWKDIAPGVYRVSARVKFEGELGLIGTPILLSVEARNNEASKAFHACDFTEAGKYYELSFLYEVAPTGDVRCPPRSGTGRRSRWGASMQTLYAKAYPKSDVAEKLRKQPPVQAPSGLRVSLTLPKTKYLVKEGLPPNSLRWLRLDWIRMQKTTPSPGITVRYVKATKAWLRPGEANAFAVSLKNYHGTAQKGTLVVSLERGLDQREVIRTEAVTLGAGASKTMSVPWKTTAKTPVWGYEVRAEMRTGDAVTSSSRDFFSVHPQVYAVHVMGSNIRATDPFRHRESYKNLGEWFGFLSGDSALVCPKQDAWVFGMSSGGGWCTMKYTRAFTEAAHANGIAQHMYLYAGGCSTPMMEMYARHPEYAQGPLVATDQIYNKIREREKEVWAHDFEKTMLEPLRLKDGCPHVEHGLNHWFPALKKKIERETVEVIRKTGFDGIRFDVGIFGPMSVVAPTGEKLPYDMDKAMQHAAKNFNDY